jgi:hypothetical protein
MHKLTTNSSQLQVIITFSLIDALYISLVYHGTTSCCLVAAPKNRYSSASVLTSLPAGDSVTPNQWLQFEVKFMLLPTASLPVRLVVKPTFGAHDQILLRQTFACL